MRSLRIWVVVVGLVLGAFAAWTLFKPPSPDSVLRLLAKAYSENRTLEVRIPGAKHAPTRVLRGGDSESATEPKSFIEADLYVSQYAHLNANNARWLHAAARDELLKQNYSQAIQHLQHAREIQENEPDLMTDLASAYFIRAQQRNQPLDYGNAIEILGEALAMVPDDPVALFNRAVICERLFLYGQAERDWQHYLRIDARSDWADEAREHLRDLTIDLKEQANRVGEPLLEFSDVAKLEPEDKSAFTSIEARAEEYLQSAVIEWLPIAYPAPGSATESQAEARSALQLLAKWIRVHHGDSWLSDLLSTSSSPQFPAGVEALSRLLKANDDGNTEAARTYAQKADAAFSAVGNLPGSLRARVEYVFAAHIEQEGAGCLRAAKGFRRFVEDRAYPWLRIQFHLEEGTCYWLTGDMGRARNLYTPAASEAQQSNYKTLYLRTQDHIAALECNTGKSGACWERLHNALDRYWHGTYPAMRGYNLYYNLQESARTRKQPFLQIAAWRDGLRLSNSFQDNALRAMAHWMMANAASVSDDGPDAEIELSTAERLFNLAPPIKATLVARLEARTRLAEVETKLGKFSAASQDLREMEPQVASLSDNFLSLLFYTNLGEAESRLHNRQTAEAALRSAITFAEKDLRSLKDERARLEWSEKSSGAYRNLVDLEVEKGDVTGALEIWEWFRGASLRSQWETNKQAGPVEETRTRTRIATADSDRVASLPRLHTVSDHLAALKTQTIVSYVRLPESYFVWVYDDRGIFGSRIQATPESINSLANHFRQLCADPSSDIGNLNREARALFDLLVQPVQTHLTPGRTLVFEDDDALSNLAFAALRDDRGNYLTDQFSIVSSLGFYYGLSGSNASPIKIHSQALVVAVSHSAAPVGEELPALPQVASEGRNVAASFTSSELLEGSSATVAAVSELVAGKEVFHFAGHAIALPRQTGLLLADGILDYNTLAKTDLSRMQVAVLSACDTVGEIESSEGNPESLVRLFTMAGVPRIIASRWNIDSEQTRQFMEKFYSLLIEKGDASVALRMAEADVRNDTKSKHPYYWAAFTEFWN